MAAIAKMLRSTAGERAIDRAFLLASLLIIAILVFEVRSTISGMNASVTIGSIEAASK